MEVNIEENRVCGRNVSQKKTQWNQKTPEKMKEFYKNARHEREK